MTMLYGAAADQAVLEISHLGWRHLDRGASVRAIWAYYYFSIQFRENLQLARAIFPDLASLARLEAEECETDNLSPFPGIAAAGERMNHDEFLRRTLSLLPAASDLALLESQGAAYLESIRALNPRLRALSIAAYEDGGLERVFSAMLKMPCLAEPAFAAFAHFATCHIAFDSDGAQSHGALCRELPRDPSVARLWRAFLALLSAAVPELLRHRAAIAMTVD